MQAFENAEGYAEYMARCSTTRCQNPESRPSCTDTEQIPWRERECCGPSERCAPYETCGFLKQGRKVGKCGSDSPLYSCDGILGFLGLGTEYECPPPRCPKDASLEALKCVSAVGREKFCVLNASHPLCLEKWKVRPCTADMTLTECVDQTITDFCKENDAHNICLSKKMSDRLIKKIGKLEK